MHSNSTAIGIEEFIIKNKHYPPVLIEFSQKFIPRWILENSVPIILKNQSMPSGRRAKSGSQLKSQTPAFVLFNRMYWGKNVLNKPGIHAGNNFDLSTPNGMALFLHEVYHVYQFYSSPLKMIYEYIRSPIASLIYGHILYDHRYINFEREAIKFQYKLERELIKDKYKQDLDQFIKLR